MRARQICAPTPPQKTQTTQQTQTPTTLLLHVQVRQVNVAIFIARPLLLSTKERLYPEAAEHQAVLMCCLFLA